MCVREGWVDVDGEYPRELKRHGLTDSSGSHSVDNDHTIEPRTLRSRQKSFLLEIPPIFLFLR